MPTLTKRGISVVAAVLLLLVLFIIFLSGIYDSRRYETFQYLDLALFKPDWKRNRPEKTLVSMTVEQFAPSRNTLEGHVRIHVDPNRAKNEKELDAPKAVSLSLSHRSDERQSITQGGSDTLIKMESNPISHIPIIGDGTFKWRVITDMPPFWYPFDRYRLYVNPYLLIPSEASKAFALIREIDALEIDVRTANLLIAGVPRSPTSPDWVDPYNVSMKRPIILRIMAVGIGLVAIFFLFHLVTVTDVDSLMWQSVTYFATLWGVRNILLTGVAVFPVLIDYATLTLYLLTSLILISKRLRVYCRSRKPETFTD